MVEPHFEITKDAAGEYRLRLRAPNAEIIAASEGYKPKSSCKNGIESVKKNAPKAMIRDLAGEQIHVRANQLNSCIILESICCLSC